MSGLEIVTENVKLPSEPDTVTFFTSACLPSVIVSAFAQAVNSTIWKKNDCNEIMGQMKQIEMALS